MDWLWNLTLSILKSGVTVVIAIIVTVGLLALAGWLLFDLLMDDEVGDDDNLD